MDEDKIVSMAGRDTRRLVAVLCYNREPGITSSDKVRRLSWGGRAA